MKKFFTLFALICFAAVTAQAQIESLDQLSNDKAYRIYCVNRASYMVTSENWLEDGRDWNHPGFEVNDVENSGYFAILQANEKYYLYSIARKKFVDDEVSVSTINEKDKAFPLVEEPTETSWVELSDAGTAGFYFKMNGVSPMNCSSGWTHNIVGGWYELDAGNCYHIIEVEGYEFDPTDALAKLGIMPDDDPDDQELATADVLIDMINGQFTVFNGGGTLAKTWVSNEAPVITFNCAGGNNMVGGTTIFNNYDAGDNVGLFKGQTYTISVEAGYVITGYDFVGSAMDSGAEYTVTANEETHTFTTEESSFSVEFKEGVASTSFTTGGTGFILSKITVHVQQLPTKKVNYVFLDANGSEFYREKIPTQVGTVVSELPEELKRDFTEYTYGNPITVEKGVTNVFEVTAVSTLPFSTEEAQYLTVNGMYMYYDAAEGIVKGTEIMEPINQIDPAYQWTLAGDMYNGFLLQNNAAEGTYFVEGELTLNDGWRGYIVPTEEETPWFATASGNGFALTHGSTHINNFNGVVCVHNYPNGTGGEDSRMTAEELVQPDMATVYYSVVDVEGNEIAGWQEILPAGTTIDALPEELIRPFTEYTLPDPFTAEAEGDNIYTATATFVEPFSVCTPENPQSVYILMNENRIAIGTANESTFGNLLFANRQALAGDATGDLTTIPNWAVDQTTLEEAVADESKREQYGFSLALDPAYQWQITGSPYLNYTFLNENGHYIAGVNSIINVITAGEEEDPFEFEIIPVVTEDENEPAEPAGNGVRNKVAEGVNADRFILKTDLGYVSSYINQYFQFTENEAAAAEFTFATVDPTELNNALEAYLEAQNELDQAVGVSTVKVSNANAQVFDLQGRRVNGLLKGVNIVNGQKVLVK
ncbi:MAG: hypothetical protein IJ722_01295 [Alloprevotella sp.]|nr:hypothetical protein [Alloprevotella sp.]